jgi:tetratricopeptide (TPR) repeat protein
VRELRLACFGMLDEPKRLAECLVRLALAQDRANDLDGFRETFRRVVEVEERFTAYSRGELSPDLKAEFEDRLPARIPAATLEAVQVFKPLVKTAPAPAGKGREHGSDAGKPAEPTAQLPPRQPPKPPPTEPSSAEQAQLAQARELLAGSRSRDLRRAFTAASEVADAYPLHREAQLLAAEAAYRLSRWADAVRYFKRGGAPADDQPELLFYLAVSLHETGDGPGAAAALRRALPNLKGSDYVESYRKKILGD